MAKNINDAPAATMVRSFFCDNPKCHRVHVVLFDDEDEPFAQFVMPDARPDGSGFFDDLKKAVYKSAMLRGT